MFFEMVCPWKQGENSDMRICGRQAPYLCTWNISDIQIRWLYVEGKKLMGEGECVIPDDPEAESKARDEYIRRNEEEYGILLDNSKIMSNAGMRMLSKLIANSI